MRARAPRRRRRTDVGIPEKKQKLGDDATLRRLRASVDRLRAENRELRGYIQKMQASMQSASNILAEAAEAAEEAEQSDDEVGMVQAQDVV